MKVPITIFIQRGCLFSDEAVVWLRERGAPFTEWDIEADPHALATLEALETIVTPTILVGDEVIYGFAVERLSRLLRVPAESAA